MRIQAGSKLQQNVIGKCKLKASCAGYYKNMSPILPPFALFVDQLCAFVFTPTDFDIGRHLFTVTIQENNPNVAP